MNTLASSQSILGKSTVCIEDLERLFIPRGMYTLLKIMSLSDPSVA